MQGTTLRPLLADRVDMVEVLELSRCPASRSCGRGLPLRESVEETRNQRP